MKEITLTLALLGLMSTTINAQGPYSLPFQETFSTVVSGTAYDQTTLNDVLSTKGWEYVQPLGTAGNTRISFKTLSEGGYFLTPEITVPTGTALEINFVARMVLNDIGGTDNAIKKANNLHRNFYAVIGNDTVYDHQKISYDMANPLMQNLNRFMGTYIYDGTSPVKVKFFSTNTYQGVWEGKADGLIFGNNTTSGNTSGTWILSRSGAADTIPAINIAFGENIDFGTIDRNLNASGTVVAKTFPLKGKNLKNFQTLVESPIDFTDDASATIKLPVKNFTPVSGAINQTVTANITVPANVGTYTEKVTVVTDGDRASSATNALKQPTRTIWFTYNVVDTSTGLDAASLGINIFSSNGKINVNSANVVDVQIYNANGLLQKQIFSTNSTSIEMPKGLYIVKAGSVVTKIVL